MTTAPLPRLGRVGEPLRRAELTGDVTVVTAVVHHWNLVAILVGGWCHDSWLRTGMRRREVEWIVLRLESPRGVCRNPRMVGASLAWSELVSTSLSWWPGLMRRAVGTTGIR